jgi:ABC transporter substrate binding protein (PQQ-dependent alcohol dehydrogenase system)
MPLHRVYSRRAAVFARAVFVALLSGAASTLSAPVPAPDDQTLTPVPIIYLSKDEADTARASLMDPVVADYGWQGAKFGVDEANINGRFMGMQYELIKVTVPAGGDVSEAAKKAFAEGHLVIVADLKAPDLLAVADLPEAKQAMILDARTSDDSLRQRDCRDNLFHILPNWAMRADALGQFLARRHWRRWFLLTGKAPNDQAYAAAVKRTASRVGAKIVAERVFEYQPDAESVQSQLSGVTHLAAPYDVLIVADTRNAFGEFLLYNTWDPRPVAGTQGLSALAWHPLFREYAARGMQYRFYLAASREMTERDYGNYLAVSIIGEAATRSRHTDAAGLKSYLISDQFAVPAFKGEGLSFRQWDHQMRQPLLLFGPRMLVSMWPQDGSGHSKLQTDTLGYDQPQSACHLVH